MLQALVGSKEQPYSNRDIFSGQSPEVTPSGSDSVFGALFDSEKKIDGKEEKKEEPEPYERVEIIPY